MLPFRTAHVFPRPQIPTQQQRHFLDSPPTVRFKEPIWIMIFKILPTDNSHHSFSSPRNEHPKNRNIPADLNAITDSFPGTATRMTSVIVV